MSPCICQHHQRPRQLALSKNSQNWSIMGAKCGHGDHVVPGRKESTLICRSHCETRRAKQEKGAIHLSATDLIRVVFHMMHSDGEMNCVGSIPRSNGSCRIIVT